MADYYAYVYVVKNEPESVKETAPDHAAYWQGLELEGYMGGPFVDFSGGLIVFQAEDEEKARSYVESDPFVKGKLLDSLWMKPWSVQ